MTFLRRLTGALTSRIAAVVMSLFLFTQGLAEGFVLCIHDGGSLRLELESSEGHDDCAGGNGGEASLFASRASSGSHGDCCIDISSLDEFPPIPSARWDCVVPVPATATAFVQGVTIQPNFGLLGNDLTGCGLRPLGPDPLATVRLLI